jgi:hypothetical protein
MGSAVNYLTVMDFFQCEIFVFDKPTSFFFMVGGLRGAIRGAPGNSILSHFNKALFSDGMGRRCLCVY